MKDKSVGECYSQTLIMCSRSPSLALFSASLALFSAVPEYGKNICTTPSTTIDIGNTHAFSYIKLLNSYRTPGLLALSRHHSSVSFRSRSNC